ncbi:DNA polymerase eta-like [Stegodyphus dumicola]|uniref:DNA polymerase eta-like n=1 Tax=Stegodyphus dumicola TaxID=202533 RepID=UPI0015AA6CA6|nr:DNA polymerase eta-like [Stegodyphus dumicola]XP_035212813.1 DNA polymerase eta-like [Stegodyphus dumicola]
MDFKNGERVIVLVDMDCFYVQVEQKLCSEYQNKPCAVVQYKSWKGGSIIAVNYEARAKGVSRFLKGDEAQEKCPDIHLFRVPEVRGKADLTKYREAGAKVIDVLCEFSDCVERASIDEAYLDLTSIIQKKMQEAAPVTPDQLPNTFVVGWENEDGASQKNELHKWLQMIYEEDHLYNDKMLAMAAVIVEEMRSAVYERTGYRCSAGIAHNKMLAKLSCGLHKPNKQTILPQSSVQLLYNTIKVSKVRNLGGKLGEEVTKKFNAKTMGDLFKISKSQFINAFGEKTGCWLYNISRGIENEPVISRQLPKSIGCGKNFPGKGALCTKDQVTHWLTQLASEVEERLLKDQENNRRIARLLTVTARIRGSSGYSVISRSCPIHIYKAQRLAHDALITIQKLNTAPASSDQWSPAINSLSMSASKFEDKIDNSTSDIQSFFVNTKQTGENVKSITDEIPEAANTSVASDTNENKSFNPPDASVITSSNSDLNYTVLSPKKTISSFFTKVVNNDNASSSNIDSMSINNKFQNQIENNFSDIDQNDSDGGTENNIRFTSHDRTEFELKNEEIQESASKLQEPEPAASNSKYVKGFFARKLEERISSKQVQHSSNTSTLDNKSNSGKDKISFDISFSSGTVRQESGSSSRGLFTETGEYSLSSNNDPYSDLDPELTKICDKCNQHIPIWEDEEHLDYHVALDLSNEFAQELASKRKNSTNFCKSVGQNSKKTMTKRKNSSKSLSKSKKVSVQSNTLDAFIKS